MLNSRFVPWLVGIVLIAGFGYGLIHLFSLRFAHGDVYPQYSSLRTDPLGTKALYDALNATGAIETERNYRPIQRLKPAEPVTLFYIGIAKGAFWGNTELQHFERLIGSGSRAVFAFSPQQPVNAAAQKKEKAKEEADEAKKSEGKTDGEKKSEGDKKPAEAKKDDKEKEDPETAGLVSFDSAAERWGVAFARAVKENLKTPGKADDPGPKGEQVVAELLAPELPLEPDLPYRSAIYFKDLQPAWRVLYRVAGQPVVIERHWGDGTIVFVGDPFFLSNEALRGEPRPKLLTWLAGTTRKVIFDEEHHGIRENVGIAALAQKYRLQGGIIALFVVIALAIWRSAIPFVRLHSVEDDERVEGRDAAEAFTSLLRRSVAPSRILDVCLDEWRKSFSRSPNDVAAVDSVISEESARPVRDQHPVRTYRRIAEALARSSEYRRSRGTAPSPKAT